MQANNDDPDHGKLGDDALNRATDTQEVPPQTREHEPKSQQQNSAQLPPAVKGQAWQWREILGLVFDGVVAFATAVGIVFLILQWKQTDRALNEAKEANRIARKAQADAEADAVAQVARFKAQLATSEQTARAAQDSAKAAQGSAAEAHTNFIKEQRPYVLVVRVYLLDPPIQTGKVMNWNFDYANFGISPAVNVTTSAALTFGDNVLVDADKWFERLNNKALPRGNTIAPNISGTPSSYTTLPSVNPMTAPFVDFINSHDAGVAVYGRFKYWDLAGNPYWTDFCQYRMRTGAVAQCEKHNEVH